MTWSRDAITRWLQDRDAPKIAAYLARNSTLPHIKIHQDPDYYGVSAGELGSSRIQAGTASTQDESTSGYFMANSSQTSRSTSSFLPTGLSRTTVNFPDINNPYTRGRILQMSTPAGHIETPGWEPDLKERTNTLLDPIHVASATIEGEGGQTPHTPPTQSLARLSRISGRRTYDWESATFSPAEDPQTQQVEPESKVSLLPPISIQATGGSLDKRNRRRTKTGCLSKLLR